MDVSNTVILSTAHCLDESYLVAGEVQAPGSQSQEAGRAADAAQAFASAEQQSLLQFLRMMRKGKVGLSSSPSQNECCLAQASSSISSVLFHVYLSIAGGFSSVGSDSSSLPNALACPKIVGACVGGHG